MSELALFGGPKAAAGLDEVVWPQVTDEDVEAVRQAVVSGRWCRLYQGSRVEQFEAAFGEYHQARHVIAVCNGTAALELALQAAGVRPGDDVLVPAVSFIATASAVTRVGAIPVFVDLDAERITMSPAALEEAITPRTTAVIVVHYGGYPADMDAICEITERRGLALIEDCAHAQGSEWQGRRVGTFGAAGAFSFQESKALSGGEGGAVTTNDDRVADRARLLQNIGRVMGRPGYEHYVLASNYRMAEVQGALLCSQLTRLPEQVAIRQEAGQHLSQGLSEIDGLTPLPADPRVTQRGYYFYVVRFSPEVFEGVLRDRFVEALAAEGVPCSVAYGMPLYRQPAFSPDNIEPLYRRDTELPDYSSLRLPVAERFCSQEQITLPQTVLLTGKEGATKVLDAICKVVEHIDKLR